MKRYETEVGTCYHPHSTCYPNACPYHNPSNHKMKWWPCLIRWDRDALVERICPHGVGHPDPDDLNFRAVKFSYTAEDIWADGVHGCDGCCSEGKALP